MGQLDKIPNICYFQYGLYSQFVGPFVYIFLGSCRQMTIGPTAIVQLFTYQKCGDNFPECVVLMGFYSGIVELILGVLQLGKQQDLIE